MVIDMNDVQLVTLEQLRGFLAGAVDLGLTPRPTRGSLWPYQSVLKRFKYPLQSKAHRGLIRRYLRRVTGYSRPQLSRLIAQYLHSGRLVQRYRATTTSYARKFTPEDIVLLAELDSLHGTLSGPATRVLLQRAFHRFGQASYERLATISVSHLYNLRAKPALPTAPGPLQQDPDPAQQHRHPARARSRGSSRVHPHRHRPSGRSRRHQGLYHINAVDIVTQWQLVATCEQISEAYLLPVIAELLAGFPFVVLGFHSDGGGEYINHDVAKLLEKLRVEFTRSRPQHTNDNALVESKNGSVIRKQFGYAHIAQRFAGDMNAFCGDFLNPYVNFHRPCYFSIEEIDAKGKIRKRYPHQLIMTPFDKLKALHHRYDPRDPASPSGARTPSPLNDR